MKALRGIKIKLLLATLLLGGSAVAVWWDALTQRTPPAPEVRHVEDASPPAPVAPNVAFTALNGRKITTWNDLTEPQILVHFWASWCPPCLVEMPKLMAYAKAHQGQMAVVMVSTDDDKAAMEKALRPYKHEPVLWVWDSDKALSLKTFQVLNVPETVRLDAQRRMVEKRVGPQNW